MLIYIWFILKKNFIGNDIFNSNEKKKNIDDIYKEKLKTNKNIYKILFFSLLFDHKYYPSYIHIIN